MDEEADSARDPLLSDLVGSLRGPVSLGDRPVDRAMRQLRRESRRPRLGTVFGWSGALAASVLLALFGSRRLQHGVDDGITFALSAPAAGRVTVIGDFNDWNPEANPLARRAGEWSVTLRLKPGRYRYSFVVDGSNWQADPHTPAAEDDFGTPTSVITVPN